MHAYLYFKIYDCILPTSIVLLTCRIPLEASISICSLRFGGRKQGCGLYYECHFVVVVETASEFKNKPAARVENE